MRATAVCSRSFNGLKILNLGGCLLVFSVCRLSVRVQLLLLMLAVLLPALSRRPAWKSV